MSNSKEVQGEGINTLFRNAQILLPDASVIHGAMGVCGNRIAFVGESPAGFAAQRVIDCDGNILMPGLVNSHTHLPMNLLRSLGEGLPLHRWLNEKIQPLESRLTEEMVYWGALLAAAEMIRGGSCAFNDMYFHVDAIASALGSSGLRGLLGPTIVSPFDQTKRNDRFSIYEKWHGNYRDRIRFAVAPHAEYTCDVDALWNCVAFAHDLGVPLHIHISETAEEHAACKARNGGLTPVQLLHSIGGLEGALLAHCVHVEEEDIALIAEKGAVVLHNPQSNLKLGSGVAPVPAMLAAGCKVSLGTDGAASNNNLDMFEEMRLAATLHKGVHQDATLVSIEQALTMATANGAGALGFDGGKLEAGKLADVIMIDAHAPAMLPGNDPAADLVYSASSGDVLLNIVDGQILYERGEYFTLPYDEIRGQVKRIAESLLEEN